MVCAQDAYDLVRGNLIQFNDNGAWCWYQDERAVVDITEGNLTIGSDASGAGVGGSSRDGHIEGVIVNLNTRLSQRFLFMDAGCDDHNTPAFLIRPDGKYLTMYAQHYHDYSRYRIFDGHNWGAEHLFDWSAIPGGTDFSTTYSNLFYLSAENKVYNFIRCYARSPNMMASKQVEIGDHHNSLILRGDGNTYLYQAYLGRVSVYDSNNIEVFVDDEAVETGTMSNMIGDITRTWYDGISYASMANEPAIFVSEKFLDFGPVLIDSSKTDSILVLNPGSDSLHISSITSTNPRYTVTPSTLVLGPSESNYLLIVFLPQSISDETGYIILTHNAPGSRDSIRVTGEGIGPDAVQDDLAQVPVTSSLNQNYPNPFNPSTVISWHVGSTPMSTVQVDLSIYNLLGQKVATLVSKSMPADNHEIEFNAENIASGVYLYRIVLGEWQDVRKMVLLR